MTSTDVLTNKDRWDFLMKDVESPNIYLSMGYYFLIAAALQRRVWFNFGTNQLFPNMYVILTGYPGVGKGRVITQVSYLLKYHKKKSTQDHAGEDRLREALEKGQTDEMVNAAELLKAEAAAATSEAFPQLFPTLPDSTSLRSLTSTVAKSFRSIRYMNVNPHTGETKQTIYGHSSCAFILEELSDLFKDNKETADIARFLNRAWDCGEFKHSTEHAGKDEIKFMCVSLLAGTTPDHMKNIFASSMMNEGLSARTLFIWAERNRFMKWNMGELNTEQLAARKQLLEHLSKISTIAGPLRLTEEAEDYLRDWYENKSMAPAYRVNHNFKLEHYYVRKKMHLLKLAMAIHFSDSYSFVINLDEVQQAMSMLEEIEKSMHFALAMRGRNELNPIGSIIVRHIKKYGQKSGTEIYFDFAEDIKDKAELQTLLGFLVETKQLTAEVKGTETFYKIPELRKK